MSAKTNIEIEPLYDRILIKRTPPEEMFGSLYIPDDAQEPPSEGTVVSLGEGRINPTTGETTPMKVAPGDLVLFGKYAGVEFEINGEKLLVIREEEILGILRNKPKTKIRKVRKAA